MRRRVVDLVLLSLFFPAPFLGAQQTDDPRPIPYPERWEVARPAPVPAPVGDHVLALDRQELVEMLRAGRFDALDRRFRRLEERVSRDVRWEEQLFSSYRAFYGPDPSLRADLDAWVEAPAGPSYPALVARAWFWHARAIESWRDRALPETDEEAAFAVEEELFRRGMRDARRAIGMDSTWLGAHLVRLELYEIYDWADQIRVAFETGIRHVPASYLLREQFLRNLRDLDEGRRERVDEVVEDGLRHRHENPRLAELRAAAPLQRAERLRNEGDLRGALAALDEAEAAGAGWQVHQERALVWHRVGGLVRALESADRAVAEAPAAWQTLEVRARILLDVADVSTIYQVEDILAQALADQDEAILLQPRSHHAPRQRDRIAAFQAECAASALRCLAAADERDGPAEPPPPQRWWVEILLFVVGVPVTLAMVLVEGNRYYLLPVPLLVAGSMAWSLVLWRRHRFWTPPVVHAMAALAFLLLVAINVAWVRAGGSMWTQRYVVIVVATLVPYAIYLALGGPHYMARKGRIPPPPGEAEAFQESLRSPSPPGSGDGGGPTGGSGGGAGQAES